MIKVNLSDVQGNVARGYKHPEFRQLFGTIGDRGRWKAFLAALANRVTRGDEHHPDVAATLNVALSFEGVAALAPRWTSTLRQAFPAFAQGMGSRADVLGDPPVDQESWKRRHVWVFVHAKDQGALDSRVRSLYDLALAHGVELEGASRPGKVIERGGKRLEHFGFRDGIANPVFEGSGSAKDLAGNGKRDAQGNWAPIATGEFLLGYPNEQQNDLLREVPDGLSHFLRNGTFAVLRVLEQDVAGFRRFFEDEAEDGGPDLAERMVGRTRDGKSLVAPDRGNDFEYRDDPFGAKCPLGSHVRRSNPRESGEHRLIRRSIPYGSYVEQGDAVPEGERGIYFIAMNASLENQFEFLQRNWLNGEFNLRTCSLSGSQDPLAATGEERRRLVIEGDVIAGRRPRVFTNIPAFVKYRGGQYYFMPGIAGLRAFASQEGEEVRRTPIGLARANEEGALS